MNRDDLLEFVGVVLFIGCAAAITTGIIVAAYVTGGYIAAFVGAIVTTIALLVAVGWTRG